jgi:outer membrane protein OmpA-like peptidoglycan-associated protein
MVGGQLTLDGVSMGCCSSTEVPLGPLADNILYAERIIETRLVEVPVVVPHTTGEEMAGQYRFVAPAEDFTLVREALQNPGDRAIVDRFIAETRQGSISIYFGQGLRALDDSFSSNNKSLVELIAAVRALILSGDSRVAAIVIAGFSSPEGSPELNDRLAYDRAVVVKDFLVDNTGVDPSVVRVFNGGADWAGLRKLVERSSMYDKQRVLEIIDRGGADRLAMLRRLDGGRTYRYMLENLFPKLRQAAYIKVYYESK